MLGLLWLGWVSSKNSQHPSLLCTWDAGLGPCGTVSIYIFSPTSRLMPTRSRLDTIYACQDKRDDTKAGVKSTALLFDTWIKPILSVFASALLVSLWYSGRMNNMGVYYYTISVGGGSLYLATDMLQVDLNSPKSCWSSVRIYSLRHVDWYN